MKKKQKKEKKEKLVISDSFYFNFEDKTDDEEFSIRSKNSINLENDVFLLEDKFGILLKNPLKRTLSDFNRPDLDFLHQKKRRFRKRIKKVKKRGKKIK